MSRVPLEPRRTELDAMGAAAMDFLADFVEARATAPASDLDVDHGLLARVAEGPPEQGRPFADLLALMAEAAAKGFDTAGPGYMAFIPGSGLVTAALADLLVCGINRFTNLAAPAPALVQMEASVLAWMTQLFGLPAGCQGIFTSGGSLSNLSAIITARTDRLGEDLVGGTLYTSQEAHHSVLRAARLAGLPAEAVRQIPCTPDLRIDTGALEERLVADRLAGLRPFCVVANAGTTNTGAIDDLPVVADIARRHGLWLHVDAAYGGFFQLTERGRRRLTGIELADSITLDPHKSMFFPYGTGCLLVRDGETLRTAHAGSGQYLQDAQVNHELPNYAEYSPELSRDARGVRVWLPLHLHGVGAFRDALDEKLDLTNHVHDRLRHHPRLEVPWTPELSIVAFRHRSGDDAARRVLNRVNASRRVFLSSTVIDGHLTLRVCVLSFRTHLDRVDEAIDLIAAAAAEE